PVEVRFADVDLAGLAREVTVLVTPQAKLAHIHLIFAGPADAPDITPDSLPLESILRNISGSATAAFSTSTKAQPAWIRGDSDMLKQAVLNLLTNAIEVLKNGGQVRVSVKQENDSVVLEVADNGPGIPPELRDKVFQLYFTTKEKGSGIGLAM